MDKISIERIAAYVIVVGGVALFAYFLALPLFFSLLPLLLGFVAAYACRPLAVRLHRLTRVPVGGLSVFLVFFFLFVASLLLFFALRTVAGELLALGNRLVGEGDPAEVLAHAISSFWSGVTERLPFLASLAPRGDEEWERLLLSRLGEIGGRLGEKALAAAGKLAQALPAWLLFLAVSLIAAFYFARDMAGVRKALGAFLPRRVYEAVIRLKNGAWQAALGYLRAYLLLMLLTFALLLCGFLLLGIPYAVLAAAVLAVLDFLPVLGVGLFLVPWGIFALLVGQSFRGVGLLILYAAITLVRQVMEPRIIGRHFGLHPLLTLAAMYVGFRLFGFLGLVLLPPACLLLRSVFFSSKAAEPGEGKG